MQAKTHAPAAYADGWYYRIGNTYVHNKAGCPIGGSLSSALLHFVLYWVALGRFIFAARSFQVRFMCN